MNTSSDLPQPDFSQTTLPATTSTTDPLNEIGTHHHVRIRLASTSFDVQAGQRIALVGESGSGKSSLLQATLGLCDHQGDIWFDIHSDGNIAINTDVNLVNNSNNYSNNNLNNQSSLPLPSNLASIQINQRNLNPETLHRMIGYLAQQVPLLPLSIAENLRLAAPNATEDMLIEVLNSVGLGNVIMALPKGLDTSLGERGRGLSGGQQQRLGIAQLLLRDAPVWLLDEPTEHLDPDTADQIHELLRQVSVGKTVIWVTHHVEALPWLDKVVTLQATHDQTDTVNPKSA